jgi:hypothetical protein
VQGLSQGLHTISVTAEGIYNYWIISYSGTYTNNSVVGNSNLIDFYMNNYIRPEISNLSLSNGKYNVSNVPLNFTVNEPTSWIGYSLDGKLNITTAGNTTLTALTNGVHNLIIYANDTLGNTGISETVSFSVAKPKPFPIVTVAAVSGTIALIVAAGLLVYFKKNKR